MYLERNKVKECPQGNYRITLLKQRKDLCQEREKCICCQREREREEVHKFILKQLRKDYIRPLELSQTVLVFFVGKKNGKKRMVQNYRYLNK